MVDHLMKDVGLILANTSRSRAYLAALVRHNLHPSWVLLLDDDSKEKIFKILKNRKITIINSTHDPDKFQNVDFTLNIEINSEIRKVRIQEL